MTEHDSWKIRGPHVVKAHSNHERECAVNQVHSCLLSTLSLYSFHSNLNQTRRGVQGECEVPTHHSLGRKILTSNRSALVAMSFGVG